MVEKAEAEQTIVVNKYHRYYTSIRGNSLRCAHAERLRYRHRNIDRRHLDLFDGHCDGQNGLHTNVSRQRNICNRVAWCE